MIVAEITKDYLGDDLGGHQKGREFDYSAMLNWWGWDDSPNESDWLNRFDTTKFKLYDDDGELYYEGWLINDNNEAVVQQFVLDWGKSFAGCTTITVQKDGKFIQEIG